MTKETKTITETSVENFQTHTYILSDGEWNGPDEKIHAANLKDAVEQAKEIIQNADYMDDSNPSTVVIDCTVRSADESEEEQFRVVQQPRAPSCYDSERGHNWTREGHGGLAENPGVFSHGGGITINEHCTRCGVEKTTDTWDDSHSPPVETTSYTEYDGEWEEPED